MAILMLLSLVGFETNIREMKRVGQTAFFVAVIGVMAPMGRRLGTMKFLRPDSGLAHDRQFVAGRPDGVNL
jgi:Kef-type K+ transport system membrane component KefB